MCALVDVCAALVGNKGFIAIVAGAGEGAQAVGAGGVGPAVGQGVRREPGDRTLDYHQSSLSLLPRISTFIYVQTPPVSALSHTFMPVSAILGVNKNLDE